MSVVRPRGAHPSPKNRRNSSYAARAASLNRCVTYYGYQANSITQRDRLQKFPISYNAKSPTLYLHELVAFRPTLPLKHPECTTLLSGYTRIALPPNRLWHTAQCLSSSMTTLLFNPPGTCLPCASTLPSPSKTAASISTFSTARSRATIRSSFIVEFALRIRPRKYDSNSLTGSVGGTKSSVVLAGSRAPWRLRRSSAGGQLGWCGGGGARYNESRTW